MRYLIMPCLFLASCTGAKLKTPEIMLFSFDGQSNRVSLQDMQKGQKLSEIVMLKASCL